jgi:16S rRNA (uracil1498-N3)-methyltransferase
VLRIQPPAVVTVTDGRGTVARAAASRVERDRLVLEVLEKDLRRRATPEIVVYQAAAKGHKLDDAVQCLAEIGVSEFWVFESSRAVVRWDRDKVAKLNDRWSAISKSATKQSRNPYLLKTGGGLSWTEALRRIAAEPLACVLWEDADIPLRTTLVGGAERVAVVVGPEGGLARAEAEALADGGAQLASLGPLIVRTEHASVVAASALMFHYGLIG